MGGVRGGAELIGVGKRALWGVFMIDNSQFEPRRFAVSEGVFLGYLIM